MKTAQVGWLAETGSIGVDELEDPLIALGLAESKEKVAEIIKEVDTDGSGQIEFNEFLSIIKKGAVREASLKLLGQRGREGRELGCHL